MTRQSCMFVDIDPQKDPLESGLPFYHSCVIKKVQLRVDQSTAFPDERDTSLMIFDKFKTLVDLPFAYGHEAVLR